MSMTSFSFSDIDFVLNKLLVSKFDIACALKISDVFKSWRVGSL